MPTDRHVMNRRNARANSVWIGLCSAKRGLFGFRNKKRLPLETAYFGMKSGSQFDMIFTLFGTRFAQL